MIETDKLLILVNATPYHFCQLKDWPEFS